MWKTAHQYGIYHPNSYTYSNNPPSACDNSCSIKGSYPPNPHEDYRPIYFYVAQPYTIPYAFARRPRPSSLQKSGKTTKSKSKSSNNRVKFSKKLSAAEFSHKVRQGEFSKSLNQVQFAEATRGQGEKFIIDTNLVI